MINTRPPRRTPGFTDTRDFERWMNNIHRKVGESDTSTDDLEQERSVGHFLGQLHELAKKFDSLTRDTRNLKSEIELLKKERKDERFINAEIEALKRDRKDERNVNARIASLEHRVLQMEGEF